MHHPDPEANRELEMLYGKLPRHQQIIWDAEQDVYRDEASRDWTPYKLPEHLFTVWAVTQMMGTTNNGGFQYFFENDWPDRPSYQLFIDALERIGATEPAYLLRTAVNAFPFQHPHLNVNARRDFIKTSRSKPDKYDSMIDRCGNRVMDLSDSIDKLLSQYVLLHTSSFPTVKQRS
jgi:hypothetical protein